MFKIDKYAFFWRPEDDSGSIHLALADNTGHGVFTDSTAETAFFIGLIKE